MNLLVVFDALLTDGRVTRAARRVGLSQPAFSNALGRLRAGIGDPLFERTGGGMAPTPRALSLAGPVRTALRDLQCALETPLESPAHGRVVTVAANEYARCLLIPRAARVLGKRAPGVRLDIRDTARPLQDNSPADLTIDWAGSPHRASATIILRDSLVGLVGARNRMVMRTINQDDFDLLDFVEVQGGVRWQPAAMLSKNCHIVPDWMSAIGIVSKTDNVAVVPHRLAAQFCVAWNVRMFRLPHPGPDVVLEVASDARSASDDVIVEARNCLLEVGRKMAGGRKK